MAAEKKLRTVNFKVYTGNVDPYRMIVNIYASSNHDAEPTSKFYCTPAPLTTDKKVFHSTATNIPKQDVWYAYEIHLYQTSQVQMTEPIGYSFDPVSSTVSWIEKNKRFLPSDFSSCRDILEFCSVSKKEDGLEFLLGNLFDGSFRRDSLDMKVRELERLMSDAILEVAKSSKKIESWVLYRFQMLGTDDTQQEKLVLLSILEGYLSDRKTNLPPCVLDNIFKSLQSVNKDLLTEWALRGISKTCHQLLQERETYHWVYFIVHFHQLFDPKEILDMRKSVRFNTMERTDANKLMSNIAEIYSRKKDLYDEIYSEALNELGLDGNDATNLAMLTEDIKPSSGTPNVPDSSQFSSSLTLSSHSAATQLPFCTPKPEEEQERKFVFNPPLPVSLSTQSECPTLAETEKRISFRLLVQCRSTSSLTLCLRHSNDDNDNYSERKPMTKANLSHDFKDDWWYGEVDREFTEGKSYTYHYAITSTDPFNEINEKEQRQLDMSNQNIYDVFIHPSEPSSRYKTNSLGTLLFLDILLSCTTEENLRFSLMEALATGFPKTLLPKKSPDKFFSWFQRRLQPVHKNSSQVTFLAVLLGKLITLGSYVPKLPNKDFQFIAKTLGKCPPTLIPQEVFKDDVHSICCWLINGFEGNWLHLWYYFFELLTAEDLVTLHDNVRCPTFELLSTYEDSILDMIFKNALSCESGKLLQCAPLVGGAISRISELKVFERVLKLISQGKYRLLAKSEIVTDATAKKLKDLLRTKSVTNPGQVVDIWRNLEGINMPGLVEEIRSYTMEFLLVSEKWPSSSLSDVETLILKKALYKTSNDFKEVMNRLLTGKNVHVLRIFTKVLKRVDLLVLINDFQLKEMIKRALEFSASLFKENREEAMETIYTVLAIVTKETHMQNKQDLKSYVDNEVYMCMQKITIYDMLKSISLKKIATPQYEEFILIRITEHIQRRLREQKGADKNYVKHCTIFCDNNSGRLNVDSPHVYKVLTCMIECKKAEAFFNYSEATVLKILKDAVFWLMVFNVSGKFQNQIFQNNVVHEVQHFLKRLKDQMLERSITIGFLSNLKHHRKELTELMKFLPAREDTTNLEEILEELKQCEQLFRNRLNQLDLFSGFLVSHLMGVVPINDRDILKNEIKMRRNCKEINRTTVNTTTTEQYWGLLYPLLSEVEVINPLLTSNIFLNICRSIFEGTCPNFLTDMNETIPEIYVSKGTLRMQLTSVNFTQLATLISKSCLPVFRQQGRILLQSNLEVPLNVVNNLMDGTTNESLDRELQIVTEFFGSAKTEASIPSCMKSALVEYVNLPDLREKSNQLKKLFEAFDVAEIDEVNDALTTLRSISRPHSQGKSHTLMTLHSALETIASIDSRFRDIDWTIMEELGKCKDLIVFLRPRINEDMFFLTDAVDERAEQYVNESTVSDFLAVKRYLILFLTSTELSGRDLLEEIVKNRENATKDKIDSKICNCTANFYSILDIYKHLAERSESTKEKIFEALSHGHYRFYVDDQNERCHVTLTCRRKTTDAEYGLEDLNDLRSRASLLVNQYSQHKSSFEQLQDFIEAIGIINEIVELRSLLLSNPWFTDPETDEVRSLKDLRDICHELQIAYNIWLGTLKEARRKYYYLIFFQSKHLKFVEEFLSGRSEVSEDLKLLFRYIHSGVQVTEELQREYFPPLDHNQLHQRLFHLGSALQRIFGRPDTLQRRPSTCQMQQNRVKLESTVRPGSVYVVELDIESTKSIPVLLDLYKSTCDGLPEPNEVVFCHWGTSWEEVYLLLQRCLRAGKNDVVKKLYTLVNVELLQTDLQIQLVTEVQQMHEVENKSFLLALICRGGKYHHVIDQFSPNYIHQVSGLSDNEMAKFLQSDFSGTQVITSTHPGLGKTEYINQKASDENCGVLTFHASGPVTKEGLARQLKEHTASKHRILHIDAASMSNPDVFDSFIFEVIVIGMSVSGTIMCTSPTSRIFLEVANTQQDKLMNALTICSWFKRIHLTWPGFSSFTVSNELSSPVQVVCHYLKALEDDTVDKDIQFTGEKAVRPLKAQTCQELMERNIKLDGELSFAVVNNFLEISAHTLRSMSLSVYLSTKNLKDMIGKEYKSVRTNLAKTILEASKEFSIRSVSRQTSKCGLNPSMSFIQHHTTSLISVDEMVARMRGMIRWSETNHLLPVFNDQDSQTISLLYRMLHHVPSSIRELYEVQLKETLVDYQRKTQKELQTILERICRSTRQPFQREKLKELKTNYALTPDNFLKMVLIYLRIRCNIPVIIMGETGCGKTTLVTYLARVCEVHFTPLNLHAGVDVQKIRNFVEGLVFEAEKNLAKDVWGFLDEINTCDYLSVISEMVCHKRFEGKDLPPNLKFIAACNPYRLRVDAKTIIEEIAEAFRVGIEIPTLLSNVITEEIGLKKRSCKNKAHSRLVYRVQPLPETMMDHVWDYGSLSKKDELRYIKRMIGFPDTQRCTFVHLLALSQEFVRHAEEAKCIRKICAYYKKSNSWFIQVHAIQKIPTSLDGFSHSVSLRDVNRCKELQEWFEKMLQDKGVAPVGKSDHLNDLDIRSMVLALGHCYHSRLTTEDERMEYRRRIALIISTHNRWNLEITENDIKNMIHKEQMDLLNRMIPRVGTTSVIAKNEALRENVFVILTSILNRIPVFVIGKPGCSKSLSMQLIRSNLRGQDSSDTYFKKQPGLLVISYQGSESSTSEGIIKVFKKAKNYKQHNQDVLPVVLLDEIGLAEESASNPLKVLHSELEPTVGGYPSVAVVGISNWELDASKMNRAVYLTRPEPTIEDLALTAKAIRDESSASQTGRRKVKSVLTDEKLENLAEVFSQYQRNQPFRNFHGLRDYYFLVKYIALQAVSPESDLGMIIEKGLLRNFGGLKLEMNVIMNEFSEKVDFQQQPDKRPTVLQLIKDNVTDKHSRHLLLISSGDSALSILEQIFRAFCLNRKQVTKQIVNGSEDMEPEQSEENFGPDVAGYDETQEGLCTRNLEIILGSKFESDLSEEYNYRILSKIILCMERGVLLILKDLECIYGSLYDMLNQNYTILETGKKSKRTCRIALGPNSNPMCYVHDNFRCIVVVDEKKLNIQDPPFINRFEKQTLRYTDLMNDMQHECINRLHSWMDSFVFTKGSQFNPENMFLGYHSETLPSLVFLHNSNQQDPDELLNLCKNDLMKVACPDAVLKLRKSLLAEDKLDEVKSLEQKYFELPLHTGFANFVAVQLGLDSNVSDADSTIYSSKMIVYTHSSIYVDVSECIQDNFRVHVVKLNSIKSERALSKQVRDFWFASDAEMLVLRCIPSLDAPNMILAKCTIDQFHADFLESSDANTKHKHACIIVHLDRKKAAATDDSEEFPWHFNFQHDWQQFTVDSLERTTPLLTDLIFGPSGRISGSYCLVSDLLDSQLLSVENIILEQLVWCLSCIHYTKLEGDEIVDRYEELTNLISVSSILIQCLKMQILKYIRFNEKSDPLEGHDSWQLASASDAGLMFRCSTMGGAMLQYIKNLIRTPLAKIVFFLEKSYGWPERSIDTQAIGLQSEQAEFDPFWRACFHSKNIFDIFSRELQDPRGAETYEISRSSLHFQFPFFTIFYGKVETFCEWLLQDISLRGTGWEGSESAFEEYTSKLTDYVSNIPEIRYKQYLDNHKEDYKNDLCSFVSAKLLPRFRYSERCEVVIALLDQLDPTLRSVSNAVEYISRMHILIFLNGKLIESELQLIALYAEHKGTWCVQSLLSNSLNSSYLPDDRIEIDNQLGTSIDTVTELSPVLMKPCESEALRDTPGSSLKDLQNHDLQNPKSDVTACREEIDRCDRQVDENSVVSPEQIELNEETGSFQANLVTDVCKSILPFSSTIEKCGGLKEWLTKATVALLLAGRVSQNSSILHFLRLCRDFTAVAFTYNVSVQQVAELANFADDCDDQLSKECIFKFICDHVQSLITANQDTKRVSMLHEFLCRYFNLCLADNLDTPLLDQILVKLTTEDGSLLKGTRAVLHSVITMEASSDVCEDIILTGEINYEECPNLDKINTRLQNIPMDSPLVVACSDIIEETAFIDVNCQRLSTVETSEAKVLSLAIESGRIIQSSISCSLRYVCAAAYLRAFIHSTTDLLRLNKLNQFKAGGNFFILATSVNGLFQSGSNMLVQAFLKCLRQYKCLHDLRSICEQIADPIDGLRSISWQDKLLTSKLGYNPMSAVKHYNEAISTIVFWQIDATGDRASIDSFITNASKDPEYRLALSAAVTESFYWTQTTSTGQTDSDKLKAEELIKRTGKFSATFKLVLKRLLGVEDFNEVLKISEATSFDKLQVISVVIHLACILTSYRNVDERSSSLLDAILSCKANEFHLLPGIGPTTNSLRRNENKVESTKCFCKTLQTECIRAMSPAAYRTLDFIIHGCLLAGLECGFISDEEVKLAITGIISVSRSENLDMTNMPSCNTYPDSCIVSYLYDRIENNWRLLREIIYSKDEDVTIFLHSSLQEVLPMLVHCKNPQKVVEREKFEQDFSRKIQCLVDSIPDCQRRYKTSCLRAQDVSTESMESRLEELDDCNSDENVALRLFCNRKKHIPGRFPIFEDLRARFVSEVHETDCEYPFLELCLAYKESLQLLHHLPVLLQWNNLIASRLSQIIKRQEARVISFAELLDDNRFFPDESSKNFAKALFKSFQEAWNLVNEHLRLLVQDTFDFEMLSQESKVVVCIIAKKDTRSAQCTLHRMISTLKEVQNSFLTEAQKIAKDIRCSNLSFMLSNSADSDLKSVPINMTNSEIIQYDWSQEKMENLLQYDVDTRYGYGNCVQYNLTNIERVLARELVMDKALLHDGTAFTQFTYADELFHASSAVLADVARMIPQTNLGNELVNVLEREQGRNSTFATRLLEILEIILVLLKKTNGDPEMSLESYIQRWSGKLPGSFPERLLTESYEHAIQLQHVVDLYESLESLVMGTYLQTLEEPFRSKFPPGTQSTLIQNLTILDLKQLEMISSAIQRFVFRYVRTSTGEASDILQTNLVELVRRYAEDSFDSQVLEKLDKVTPREINLCHVVNLLRVISQQIKQLQHFNQKRKRQNMPAASRGFSTTQAAGRGRPHRRRAKQQTGVA